MLSAVKKPNKSGSVPAGAAAFLPWVVSVDESGVAIAAGPSVFSTRLIKVRNSSSSKMRVISFSFGAVLFMQFSWFSAPCLREGLVFFRYYYIDTIILSQLFCPPKDLEEPSVSL